MSKIYYVIVNTTNPPEAMLEGVYLSLFGDDTQRPYVLQLYREEITPDSIPEDLRESVQTIVSNRIDRWGLWKDLPANSYEVAELVEAVTTTNLTKGQVRAFIAALETMRSEATDNQALNAKYLYPVWNVGVDYVANNRVLYGDILYKVLQNHTSQEDWTPVNTPSLFAKVLIPDEDVIPEWEQPDSTNAYMKGDKVIHNGKTWVSTVDNNVWEPGTAGVWQEI